MQNTVYNTIGVKPFPKKLPPIKSKAKKLLDNSTPVEKQENIPVDVSVKPGSLDKPEDSSADVPNDSLLDASLGGAIDASIEDDTEDFPLSRSVEALLNDLVNIPESDVLDGPIADESKLGRIQTSFLSSIGPLPKFNINSKNELSTTYDEMHIPLDFKIKELLIKVTGTEDLESVTKLRLTKIPHDFNIHRIPILLPKLQELNLNGNKLHTLRDLGCGLSFLKILDVSRTGLISVDGLFGLSSLEELYAAHNKISNVCHLSLLPKLVILDLGYNEIQDTKKISFLDTCKSLKHLTLDGNPCCKIHNYHKTVKKLLQNLSSLDGSNYNDAKEKAPLKIISRFPPLPPKTLQPVNKRPHTTNLFQDSAGKLKLLPIRPSTTRSVSSYELTLQSSDLTLQDELSMYSQSQHKLIRPITSMGYSNEEVVLRLWTERKKSLREAANRNKK